MTTLAADSTSPLDTAADATAPRPVPARKNPAYLRYLSGQALSGLGDQVWYVALSWAAVQSVSAGTAGLLLSISAIPRLVLLLFGGTFADRYDIRKLMIGSDVLRTVVCALAAAIALATPSIGILIVLAVVFGTVDALFMPAAGAMRPRLLTPEQYAGGAVLATLAARIGLTLGAPLGGVLVAFGGLPLALAVDAATFAASVATLITVRPRAVEARAAREPYWTSFRAGISYLFGHSVLGPLVLWMFLTNVAFVGPMNVGAALLADHRGWGAQGVGLMLTGFGIGAAVGAPVIGRIKVRRRIGVVIAVLGAVQGLTIVGMGFAPDLPLAMAATAVLGLLSSPMAILSSVLEQSHADDAFRGRVSSVITLVVLGIVPLAMALMGVAVAVLGLTGAFTVSGAVGVASLLCLLAPAFRKASIPA